jgi:hypothetical protein
MFAEPKLDIAFALRLLGRIEEADAKIDEAVRLAPRNRNVLNLAGRHYF